MEIICGLSGRALFFHVISKMQDIKKKKVTGHKMIFFISSTTFV
jgi:hypothetical protein